jgi:hypothetical protein
VRAVLCWGSSSPFIAKFFLGLGALAIPKP